jgi:hypothetical protein
VASAASNKLPFRIRFVAWRGSIPLAPLRRHAQRITHQGCAQRDKTKKSVNSSKFHRKIAVRLLNRKQLIFMALCIRFGRFLLKKG